MVLDCSSKYVAVVRQAVEQIVGMMVVVLELVKMGLGFVELVAIIEQLVVEVLVVLARQDHSSVQECVLELVLVLVHIVVEVLANIVAVEEFVHLKPLELG